MNSKFPEKRGHTLVITSDKDGPNSAFESELADVEVVISQPFWPAYLTAKRIAKAMNLKLAITAGIGSDHVDLQAAMERRITVAEITYCNSISTAEHAVTMSAGRIGLAVLRRVKPFDVNLHYTDRHRLPKTIEKELGVAFHPDIESIVKVCDVVSIHTPLHPRPSTVQ